jgi:DNA (cytosine-5)-methyltransferase 1
MTFPLDGYDFIWASPPCQGYSIMRNLPWLREKDYPLLIAPTRERLKECCALYVIENVSGACLRKKMPKQLEGHSMDAGWLCGTIFGPPFYQHRYFETNFLWL